MRYYIMILAVLFLIDIFVNLLSNKSIIQKTLSIVFNLSTLLYLYFVFNNIYTFYLLDSKIIYFFGAYIIISIFVAIYYSKRITLSNEKYSIIYLMYILVLIIFECITIFMFVYAEGVIV
jgi:hypothetical protein